ncbi:MAG: TetR/AcrR family transcriptional regulator C-terminal domain-containing protein [Micropruina sp.]|uniref:TetR/AcrR family transcriptional regulator C-terminal domain-containing protein n=1 Tax=Micropruina sp. TaxID=2737536 RepID=UPI0039E65664
MQRDPITTARVIAAAAAVADRAGLAAVSMRSVGRELGVEAMSLYHHVANKAALLDGLADWVFERFEPPPAEADWRTAITARTASVRAVLTAHPWALGLVDSRDHPGPAVLRHYDAVLGCLYRGGFSATTAAQAFSVLDAYAYGFALTERNLPFDAASGANDFAAELTLPTEDYPHLAHLLSTVTGAGDYSFAAQFAIGLDIILDGLERLRDG